MAFFNFNSNEPSVIWAQIDTLERKFKKWSIVPGIEGERKVRVYALEALAAYDGFANTHPAKERCLVNISSTSVRTVIASKSEL